MSVPSAGDSKRHVQKLQTKHWSSALSTGPQSNVANERWPSTATGVLAYQRAMHFSPTNSQHHQGGRSVPFAAAGIHVSAQSGTPQ